jgi:CRP-like cAMP-binding protein
MAGLGLHTSRVRAVIQLASTIARIPAPQFRTIVASSPAISNLCIRYNETLLAQARVTAACNISHSVEARFCRWLLQSGDRAESETVPLTQEFLSEMLGERRTSVTEVAIKDAGRGCDQLLPRRHQNCRCAKTERHFLRMLRDVARRGASPVLA